jgi:hypothetical protein
MAHRLESSFENYDSVAVKDKGLCTCHEGMYSSKDVEYGSTHSYPIHKWISEWSASRSDLYCCEMEPVLFTQGLTV